ncbi:MAG: T9SS type A sorting domain-containing protein [Ignavibacteria bacterium]|nr:T9SS type A sorting domain-containing protein [Ignavibacteria bacterium]
MKKIILLEICFLFLATTFRSDRMTGWVQQNIPRQDLAVVDLKFIDSLTGYMVSSKPALDTAFIFKTTDGGNNWNTTYFDSLFLDCMDIVDKNVGYCGGANAGMGILKKTTNGGSNWFTVTSSPYILIKDIDFLNKDTGWISYYSLTDGLLQTTNGGQSWQLQTDISSPTKIFFVNSITGWVIGNSGQNLYKTTNSGVNWFVQSHTSSENYYDVYFATQDTGWIIKNIGTGNKSLVRSTNGGNNWDSVNAPIIPTESRLCFIGNKYGWAGSGLHKIFASKDGYNWGTQYSPSNRSDNISFADTLHGWAAYTGLVHTTDGGGPIVSVNQTGTEVADNYMLFPNYPNPFNQSTIINLQTSISGIVKLTVYDISGKEITTLINEKLQPGTYQRRFDAGNLSSGIYFYRLSINDKQLAVKKMMLIK